MEFCNLCNSIMKNGICTNRKCANSVFERNFRIFISDIKKNDEFKNKKVFNNSFLVESEFQNNYSWDCNRTELEDLVLKGTFTGKMISKIKYLLNANVDMEIKLVSHQEINEIALTSIKIVPIRNLKKIPYKTKTKKYKYYLYYTQNCKNTKMNNGDCIYGTDNFIEWECVGKLDYEECFNDILEDVDLALAYLCCQCTDWTLKIIDSKTGIGLKTFFSKEKAYEFFRDREIKNGKKRRTALKHIVSDYEREVPKKVLVKEHLRGDMEFEWRNLKFKLYSPINIQNRLSKK